MPPLSCHLSLAAVWFLRTLSSVSFVATKLILHVYVGIVNLLIYICHVKTEEQTVEYTTFLHVGHYGRFPGLVWTYFAI